MDFSPRELEQIRSRVSAELTTVFPTLLVSFVANDREIIFYLRDRTGRPCSLLARLAPETARDTPIEGLVRLLRLEEDFWAVLARRLDQEFTSSRNWMLRYYRLYELVPDPLARQTQQGVITGAARVAGQQEKRHASPWWPMTVRLGEAEADAYAEGRLWPLLATMRQDGWYSLDTKARTLQIRLD
jgi:hypothetical protein